MGTDQVACPNCGTANRLPLVTTGKPRCGKCQTDLPWHGNITAADLEPMLTVSSIPILLDLWAPWCGPCRAIAPVLEQLAADRAGALRVAKINVDEFPGVSARFDVRGIPTMILFDDGAERGRQVGAAGADQIARWIDSSLAAAA